MGPRIARKGDTSRFAVRLRSDVAEALCASRKRLDEFRQDFWQGARRFHETLAAARTSAIVASAGRMDCDVWKLEALGKVAAGVAHDFNNMLTSILGYSQIVLAALKPGDPLYDAVLEIQKAGQRSAALTRQLLTFSRRQSHQPVTLNPNSIVGGMEGMLRPLMGENIEFRTVLDPRLGSIHADPGQVEQVILNLVVNARDAMPQGGRLTIETANVEVDSARARRRTDPVPGRYVVIAVSDTGHGMDASVQSRLFEPFFTTKGPGRGTGLGLCTVFSIVKANGGAISIHSASGRGTRVEVYLPIVEDAATDHRPDAEHADAPGGSETILVVEDDEGVRRLACQLLQSRGYTVLSASRGDEALGVCARYSARIDLLLVDNVLPGLGGADLAWQLSRGYPKLKRLYVSGYPEVGAASGAAHPGMAVLRKPFTGDLLLRKVRDLLDTPAGE